MQQLEIIGGSQNIGSPLLYRFGFGRQVLLHILLHSRVGGQSPTTLCPFEYKAPSDAPFRNFNRILGVTHDDGWPGYEEPNVQLHWLIRICNGMCGTVRSKTADFALLW
jgi:hypothetical protein